MKKKIEAFTDLEVWKMAHKFVVDIYKLTKKFPREEMYGLVSQLRRAAISVTSNIAEGFCRFHYKDKMRFYYYARGSMSECENEVIVSRDIGYLDNRTASLMLAKASEIGKMLNGLIHSINKQI